MSAGRACCRLLLVGLAGLAGAGAGEPEPLTIVTTDGTRHRFRVEVADTHRERSRGLMYRTELAADAGMLFDFERERPVAMWMVNTFIPLDMLFIDARGTVVRIAENTEPRSRRHIESGEPVLAVLELGGGTAAALGLSAGDRVEHPLFEAP